MPIPNVSYPFDPTGVAATNLVKGERQFIPSNSPGNFKFIIPFAAPYYRASLKVVYVPTGLQMVEGVDYLCTHYFYSATTSLGQPVYGSITLINKELSGNLDLTYQTVGGDWTLNEGTITEVMSQSLLDPRTATWEQVVELPYAFPPTDHEHPVEDLTGMAEVVDSIQAVADAIIAQAEGASEAHINNKENPHEVTKAQVGLSLVSNYSVASTQEAIDGLLNNRYMTPALVNLAISSGAGAVYSLHVNDKNNPHNVTKEQLNLDFVANYPMASLSEGTGGTLDNRYMSPFTSARALI